MDRDRIQDSLGAVIPLPQTRQQRRFANDSEVLRTRQDQTRPNTEPGRGFFFLGSLPHPGGGEVPAGNPRATGDPSRQPQAASPFLTSQEKRSGERPQKELGSLRHVSARTSGD
jgi:hypothetical protein